MPLSVSVALGTYNGARFVEKQVASILAQRLLPTEIVVSDDGSSDETLAIIRRVVAAHPAGVSLTILPASHHLGVTGNFARAVQAASGDLVALCDQDDVWRPDRLSAVVPAFEADDELLLVQSDARLIDADGAPLALTLLQSLSVSAGERAAIESGNAFATYLRRNLVTGATTVFRRTLLAAALPLPPSWVHDEWLAIIAAATGRVALVDEQLVDYRQHGSNEIGVKAPTLGYRIGRMLEPRGNRYITLAARASTLVQRLERADVDASVLALAKEKARFEAVRAGYPRRRLARLRAVLAERGSYPALSSQGTLDVARDLLQPC